MINFVIPLPPITKKNSQRILINYKTGNPFIVPSKKFKEYEDAALWFVPRRSTIDCAVNVKCLFYMSTKRRVDLTNLLEAIDDILVKARLLEDDSYLVIEGHDGSRVFYCKENPRTEVYITRMAGNTENV